MFDLRIYSAWQIAVALFLLLVLFVELGFWSGRRFKRPKEDTSSAFTAVKGAILALVGLLLGFSFSISMNRFEHRRDLMLDEANAIGTAYLRGDLLPQPAQSQFKEILRTYTDARIEAFGTAAILDDNEWSSIRRADDLQTQAWNLGIAYVKENSQAAGAILLPNALNEMIDISLKREAARLVEVPPPIFLLLVVSLLIAGLLVGHSFGVARERNWPMTVVFCFLLSLVAFIIIDLDQPRRGLIKERQRVMEYLRSTMN